MSTELQTAFENDMAVIHEDGTKTFVDTEEAPALEAPEPAPANPNATVKRAEEIITRAEEKIEAEKKQKKTTTKKAAPADPSAALFE